MLIELCMPSNYLGLTESSTTEEKNAAWDKFFATHDAHLYIPTPPTFEPLCDEAQTALNKLAQMYPNQTVITGVDAVAPGFKIKYAADSNYIIEQLTSAVIALGGQI